ncbi:MAG: putative porin [Candidatus Cryptobacteroides sp.]
MAKIWVPMLLVGAAAVQTFGIDIGRIRGLAGTADSLHLSGQTDSATAGSLPLDSVFMSETTVSADSLMMTGNDSSAIAFPDSTEVSDTLFINPKDTIRIPDSLQYTDPFKFKYYIAIKDSTTRVQVRDSLISAGDTLELHKLDSLYIKDSTDVAVAKFNAWYNSLSKRERKKYDYEQALPAKIAAMTRKLEIKDSIKAVKDSITEATPRILETFVLPDSLQYKRLIMWTNNTYVNDIRLEKQDTTYNYHFHEYPFFKTDVNATYLGVIGSPVQTYDYFKRDSEDNAVFYTPYRCYNYSPETLRNFNTKTPYTELAYWGTLFANREKEESNVKVLTTQNITPGLNVTLEFHRFGGNGILSKENVNNRTFVAATNYMGKKYLMHAGYIYHKIDKNENGGIVDNSMIRDTTVDAREIAVRLSNASNLLKKNTIYLDQSYRIPFSFINNLKGRKERLRQEAVRDSIMASGDSLAIEALLAQEKEDAKPAMRADTLDRNITSAIIGHSSEYSVFRKKYEDNISTSDAVGRGFYNDRFYLHPTTSADSLRVMRLENRIFVRLQPWSSDFIISKVDVGIGDKLASYYSFSPDKYLGGRKNVTMNSVYLYAGAQGQYKKYLSWDAMGKYNFLGYEINDFLVSGNLSFSAYPFRRDRTSPLRIDAHFETSLKEPDYYEQHLYTNHFKWDNDFSKISVTKVQASLTIPRWNLSAFFGYGLLSGNIYYDTEGIVRQNNTPMSVMTASVMKNFKIWKFHLDNQVLFQLSSKKDVLPLPMLALNLRYYLQFDVVKNVMQMQIGANGTFTTKWYAPAYNPVLGVFHNQTQNKYGNCPYIDVFVNVQWKRASIFVKVVNVNMGWPNKSADYFSADGYIAPQRALKVGISWPFYILPGRSTNASASGASRGGRDGAGLPGGMSAGRGRSMSKTTR